MNHVAGGTLPTDDRPVSVHTLHAKRGWACEILAAALKLSPAGIVEHDIDAGMAAHRFKTVAAASRAAGGRP